MQKLIGYIKRSLLINLSYKFAFIFGVISVIAHLLIFYFIDKLFGSKMAPHLAPFGVNYFSYALVGIAFSSFVGTTFGSVASQVRREQVMGTLEALFITPTRASTIMMAMVLWNIVQAGLSLGLYGLLGVLLFGIDFSRINLVSLAGITLLSIVSFNSLGLISAGFIIVFKRGDPVAWLLNLAFSLLGGVYFPITVMPQWLQVLSHLLPITYAIRSVQLAVYKGATLGTLMPDIGILLLLSILFLPLGVATINYALKRAMIAGSLVHY